MKNTTALIPISQDGDRITVLGRDLHKALEVQSNYTTWIKRMFEYGFTEGVDYIQCSEKGTLENTGINPNPKLNHQLTLDTAKEIAMIQRSEIGKKIRHYFIEIEKEYRQSQHQRLENMYQQESILNKDRETQALTIAGDRANAAIKYMGMEPSMARLYALDKTSEELNVNLDGWKQFLPPAEDYQIPTLIPTDIATLIKEETGKPCSAQKINQLLFKGGYQFKPVKTWILTEKGKQFASITPIKLKTTDFYGYQIKWKVTIMDVIRQLLKEDTKRD